MLALPRWWAVSLLSLTHSGLALGSESPEPWPKPLQVVLAVVSSNVGPAAWSRTQYEISEMLDQSPIYDPLEIHSFPLRPTDDTFQDCGKNFSCWRKLLLDSSADLLVLVQISETSAHIEGRVWLISRESIKPSLPERFRTPLHGGAPPDIFQRLLEKPGKVEISPQGETEQFELDGSTAPQLPTGHLGPILPGKHQLRIRNEEDLLYVRVLTMLPGANIQLDSRPRSVYPQPTPMRPNRGWTAAGIMVAGAIAAIVMGAAAPGHGYTNTVIH